VGPIREFNDGGDQMAGDGGPERIFPDIVSSILLKFFFLVRATLGMA